MKKLFSCLLIATLIFVGCGKPSVQKNPVVDKIISDLKNKFAPDSRTAIFNIEQTGNSNLIILNGEVESTKMKNDFIEQLTKNKINFLDSIIVLEEKYGKDKWGIVHLSVANMRSEPRQAAELGTQTLLGTIIKILKTDGGWSFVQTPDKYLGWMEEESFTNVSKEVAIKWSRSPKIIVTSLFDLIYSDASESSDPISDVVAGDVLQLLEEYKNFSKIIFPDGRVGFLKNSSFQTQNLWSQRKFTETSIIKTAKQMMGVPYLWGGTSIKGVDCSGFTKTAFLLNGIQLNRDANQQAEQGEDVEFDNEFSKFQVGDLMFFGRKKTFDKSERITHVGIYMGNKKIIHSSGFVHINSFDQNENNYNEGLLKRFVRAKRILTNNPPSITNLLQ